MMLLIPQLDHAQLLDTSDRT